MSDQACGVCGRSDIPVKYCDFCHAYLCKACERRWLARARAAGQNLITGKWRDEKGNVRTTGR
jgi:hypothetical protein